MNTLLSILLWHRFYFFREHLKIMFYVYWSHTLLYLNVYYIYLMPRDIDVRLLFQVLCFEFVIEQCDIFLDIDLYLAHLAKGNMIYCHHLVRSASSSSVCCYCNILIFPSEIPLSIKLKLCRKYLGKVLYKECSFRPNPLTNIATACHSCFWLVEL